MVKAKTNLAPGVKPVSGPFVSKDAADDWRFDEANYTPTIRTVTDYDGKIFVADVTEAYQKEGLWLDEQA